MLKTHHGESIVLASNNAGKVREINALLAAEDIHVIPQDELGVTEAEETGLSFVENAIIKARAACEFSGHPAIADDADEPVLVVDDLADLRAHGGPKLQDL